MEGSPPNAVSCFQHPFDSLSVDMPGNPSPHTSSSILQLQDIRQEDGKPDAKDPKSWIESCRMNSDFRFLGGWVTVKITDQRGEGRRGGEGSSIDLRIFCEKMWLKEWTEKHPTAPREKNEEGAPSSQKEQNAWKPGFRSDESSSILSHVIFPSLSLWEFCFCGKPCGLCSGWCGF